MENEKRLIDLDKLVEHFRRTKIDEVFPEWKDLGWLTRSAVLRLTTKYRAIILNAPVVDAVEVVRCKDCKVARYCGNWYCGYTGMPMDEDDFCSLGGKKDNDST